MIEAGRSAKRAIVVFALDIGVFNLGVAGQVLKNTTAAWCRLDRGITDLESLDYGGNASSGQFTDRTDGDRCVAVCGRSIAALADLIARDVRDRRHVALGFEAPMWLPLELEESPKMQLFRPRFEAETGNEWFIQSGAAATVKAISLGVMLVEYLRASVPTLSCTTEVDLWDRGPVLLFEAFVAGTFKVVPGAAGRAAPNEWDAFTAALAFGAVHAGFDAPPFVAAEALHRAGERTGASLSIWDSIFGGRSIPLTGPPDCEIVGVTGGPPPRT
jgi:hypothetical protein